MTSIETWPLVSICIPTYNGETYIKEALQSAINQNYSNLEIVISDDASNDNTLAIIEGFKSKTNIPIKIYKHTPNGIGANWNNCIRKAKGDYIKFLFQDDILEKHCISKLMTLMEDNPKTGLVYCKRRFLVDNMSDRTKGFIAYYGNLHTYWEDFEVKQGILPGKTYLKDKQFLNSPKNKIGEPTNVLLRRECFNKVGYFNEKLQQDLDSEYWYRVMRYFDIGFVDEILAGFRLHDKQASVINKRRDIPDRTLLYKLFYKNLFWQLHNKNKWKLIKLYNPIVKRLVTIKKHLYGE
ncbi:glycosyltransferase family 2 protein [Hanstruepera marina]|uniref:glycosyltransferase family 2 protein n=1 Tax=Hanstruepera marina TaxID=2873265 RepID=UPI001CA77506|nr:glycosyltransferase family 2 protein [Hanstruepera marina]